MVRNDLSIKGRQIGENTYARKASKIRLFCKKMIFRLQLNKPFDTSPKKDTHTHI